MSRSGYSDCENEYYPPDFWRSAVNNAVAGKRGQKFLKEMLQTLEAMEVKELISDDVVTPAGEVCAIGSVIKARNITLDPEYYDFEYDPQGANENLAAELNIAPALVQEIEYLNDEVCFSRTPAGRWEYIHNWTKEMIYPD
jgi:hypothetical protein